MSSSRTGSRGGGRSSASTNAKVTIQQAKNTAKAVQDLGLVKNYRSLMKAYFAYEKSIKTAREGIQRNEQELRELPDEIERAAILGHAQQEAELEHALTTTRPADLNMYQNWARRLESTLIKEAQNVDKKIVDHVPKDHEITEDNIIEIRARINPGR
ncbi:hypothetical protein ACEPAF_7981 [Sanghuangporus sanghuang]